MATWLNKTIYFPIALIILFFFLATVLPAMASSPDWIIYQPPYYNSTNGKYYVKNNADNIIKFGICGDHSNPMQLTAKLFEGTTEIGNVDYAAPQNYQIPRSDGVNGGETGVTCNDGTSQTEAYGPKIQMTYHPTSTGTKSLKIKYFNSGNPFVFKDFDVESSDDPEGAGATGTSWNPSNVNIATFTNMININDIFGSRFNLSNQVDLPTPQGLIQKVLDVLLKVAGILAFIAFIWSGYQFVISSGDSARVEKAKKAMIGAFIGILLIISAYSLIRAVDIFSAPVQPGQIPSVRY